jgi:hypothetical protein
MMSRTRNKILIELFQLAIGQRHGSSLPSEARRVERQCNVRRSERNSHREDQIVVEGGIVRQRHLIGQADGHTHPVPDRKPAEQKTRAEEDLVFAGVLAVAPISIIDFPK